MDRLGYLKQLGKWYWHLSYPYWFSKEKINAFLLLLSAITLILLNTQLMGFNNELQGKYFTALSEKNIDGFYRLLLITTGSGLLWFAIMILKEFSLTKLGLYWKQWLTEYFLDQYFTNNTFYEVNNNKYIDNPDQRISEDIETFVDQNYLIISLIESTLAGFLFIEILASISVNLIFFAFLSAIIQILIAFLLGRVLTPLNFKNLQKKADFRYSLVQIRNHSESIALYGSQAQELTTVSRRFRSVMEVLHRMVIPNSTLSAFSSFLYIIFSVIPILILAPKFFAGNISIGDITRSGTAFYSVVSSFTWIASNFGQLSLLAVILKRLGTLQELLPLSKINKVAQKTRIINLVEGNCFALSNVTLQTPDNTRTLIKNLSVTVPDNEGLLVMGASGRGKSALIKAIAGLWTAGTGRIVRPKLEDILFLPQRPYLTLGSLRDQLLYPHNSRRATTEELQAILVLANLENLAETVGGLDVELNWSDILSLGEQQRLAFARLFLSQPRYAVLDESTSALDVENEEYLYKIMQSSNTTYISVGHRPTLVPYHQNILKLIDNVGWKLSIR
jgi:vitamin B12/bleomycin/antimicrobial peptide transport system ATP-binding/permease protein